jgi:hypothetical protein
MFCFGVVYILLAGVGSLMLVCPTLVPLVGVGLLAKRWAGFILFPGLGGSCVVELY